MILREGDVIVCPGVTVPDRLFIVTGWTARGKTILEEVGGRGATRRGWWRTAQSLPRRWSVRQRVQWP